MQDIWTYTPLITQFELVTLYAEETLYSPIKLNTMMAKHNKDAKKTQK
jgi:hypothetical protein